MTEVKNTGDPFGIQPFGKALEKAVDEVSTFLEAICLPAAQELGFLLQDKVRAWRAKNAIAIGEEARRILESLKKGEVLSAPPRVIIKVLEEGSCVEDIEVQKMWAGLLASSCTKDGADEINIIFINILSQMSSAQARIINYITPESIRRFYAHQPGINPITLRASELHEIAELEDSAVLERELNHLESLGLASWSTTKNPDQELQYEIHIDDVTLRFCARCNGYESYGEWTRLFKVRDTNRDSF